MSKGLTFIDVHQDFFLSQKERDAFALAVNKKLNHAGGSTVTILFNWGGSDYIPKRMLTWYTQYLERTNKVVEPSLQSTLLANLKNTRHILLKELVEHWKRSTTIDATAKILDNGDISFQVLENAAPSKMSEGLGSLYQILDENVHASIIDGVKKVHVDYTVTNQVKADWVPKVVRNLSLEAKCGRRKYRLILVDYADQDNASTSAVPDGFDQWYRDYKSRMDQDIPEEARERVKQSLKDSLKNTVFTLLYHWKSLDTGGIKVSIDDTSKYLALFFEWPSKRQRI